MLSVLLLMAAVNLPRSLHVDLAPWLALALHGEALLLILLATRGRLGVLVAASAWSLLLLYELVRLAGVFLTGTDPLLFDQAQLARHVLVLLSDLWGPAGPLLLGLVLLSVVGSGLLAARLFRSAARLPVPGILLSALLAFSVGLLGSGPWPARLSSPSLGANLALSGHVWSTLQQGLRTDAYAVLDEVDLDRRPDIELLVVESYGRVIADEPEFAEVWEEDLQSREEALSEAGWVMASAFLAAPVSGGRSWISDASALLGLRITHESEWQHVQARVETLPHLPAFAASQGYRTVVCRPKDRVRPGMALRNDFGWTDTVFFEDLDYGGAPVGWGLIPDQYSLGRLYEELLPEVPHPRLVFFHGVSGHGPWDSRPTWVEDWRSLEGATGAEVDPAAPAADRGALEELEFQAKRYRRRASGFRKSLGALEEVGPDYLDAVRYGLRVSFDVVGTPPAGAGSEGRLVVIYGDHQPPILSRHRDLDVPVHLVASDPALLAPFLDAGFGEGLRPAGEAVAGLESFFPLLAEATLAGDGQAALGLPLGLDLSAVVEPVEAGER